MATPRKPKTEPVPDETPKDETPRVEAGTRFVRLVHPGNGLVVPDLSYTANMPIKHADVVEVNADFEHPLFEDCEGPATNVRDHTTE